MMSEMEKQRQALVEAEFQKKLAAAQTRIEAWRVAHQAQLDGIGGRLEVTCPKEPFRTYIDVRLNYGDAHQYVSADFDRCRKGAGYYSRLADTIRASVSMANYRRQQFTTTKDGLPRIEAALDLLLEAARSAKAGAEARSVYEAERLAVARALKAKGWDVKALKEQGIELEIEPDHVDVKVCRDNMSVDAADAFLRLVTEAK
jgi:hypothetical protein